MNRREILQTLAGGAMLATRPARGAQAKPETHTYKTVTGCEIKADVWNASPGAKRPTVMWIHGGALINGSRKGVGQLFHDRLLEFGYIVISIDYRLTPETKLPEIIKDVQDAWRWVHEQGPKRFGVDPQRVAAAGGSAGGYLTLMTGFCVEPRPRALASFYGYGDLTTPWLAEPDAFYRKQPLVSPEEAERAVGTAILSEAPPQNQRGRFYLYTRQQGIWPQQVAGHDPHKESKWFDPYCPIRNVTAEYPPAILIHGTADTDVPYEESKNMAARLSAAGVEHEFITMPGVGHGLSGAKPEEAADANKRAAEFLRAHLS